MPSNAVLEAKKAKVEQLTELIKNSVSGVLVDYKGITVEEDTKLRKELREAGVNYFVEKNTLLLRAFKNCGLEGFEESLNGTTAIALSNDDQTAPARVLGKFAEAAGDEKFSRVPCRSSLLHFRLLQTRSQRKLHNQLYLLQTIADNYSAA